MNQYEFSDRLYQLCKEKLLPLGIDLRECSDASRLPFADASFDLIINRHGDFCPVEIRRLLRPGGLFITQQVGSDNDRELVEAVLPGIERPFPHANLTEQEIRSRLSRQHDDDYYISHCEFVIVNDGNLAVLERDSAAVAEKILKRFASE